jgi:hypothetical protein
MSTTPNEEFDADGNVVNVENLKTNYRSVGTRSVWNITVSEKKAMSKTPSHTESWDLVSSDIWL